jgi:four helix bundle protein
MKIEKFEDLEIWQEARDLCKFVFSITLSDAFKKDFKFRDQIRASSGSIMDNIAEGFERGGNKEFIQFLYIAKGSWRETRSQSYRAFDFQYLSNEEYALLSEKTTNLSKRISSFITYLKNSDLKGTKYH